MNQCDMCGAWLGFTLTVVRFITRYTCAACQAKG
jgi:hypothetical protein